MAGKFEIKRAKDGQFYFNLKARNREIILTSKTYPTKANAQNGVTSVMTNALLDQRFERKTSQRGEPYFVLKAANGHPLGSVKYVFLPIRYGKWGRVRQAPRARGEGRGSQCGVKVSLCPQRPSTFTNLTRGDLS